MKKYKTIWTLWLLVFFYTSVFGNIDSLSKRNIFIGAGLRIYTPPVIKNEGANLFQHLYGLAPSLSLTWAQKYKSSPLGVNIGLSQSFYGYAYKYDFQLTEDNAFLPASTNIKSRYNFFRVWTTSLAGNMEYHFKGRSSESFGFVGIGFSMYRWSLFFLDFEHSIRPDITPMSKTIVFKSSVISKKTLFLNPNLQFGFQKKYKMRLNRLLVDFNFGYYTVARGEFEFQHIEPLKSSGTLSIRNIYLGLTYSLEIFKHGVKA